MNFIKALPGYILTIFGAAIIMLGVIRIVEHTWANSPFFSVLCAVASIYAGVRVAMFITDIERQGELKCVEAYERGYARAKAGLTPNQ